MRVPSCSNEYNGFCVEVSHVLSCLQHWTLTLRQSGFHRNWKKEIRVKLSIQCRVSKWLPQFSWRSDHAITVFGVFCWLSTLWTQQNKSEILTWLSHFGQHVFFYVCWLLWVFDSTCTGFTDLIWSFPPRSGLCFRHVYRPIKQFFQVLFKQDI